MDQEIKELLAEIKYSDMPKPTKEKLKDILLGDFQKYIEAGYCDCYEAGVKKMADEAKRWSFKDSHLNEVVLVDDIDNVLKEMEVD